MSDTTTAPTPADVAPKAPEPAQAPAAPEPAKPEAKSDDTTDWKAEARKWEQRAKENAKRAEEATKTEAERLADLEERTAKAEAKAARRDIALEHKLSKEDAALLDDLTDEDAMKRLAARLAAESDKKRNHVPREGNNPETASDDRRDFVRRLTGRS